MMDREKLSGVFAPICTPFGEDDALLLKGLASNIERMNATGLRGYFALGTNGEFKALNVEERVEVVKAVVQRRAPGKVVMAGCGAESTKETIDLARRFADAGAEMGSVLMPSFFAKKMTDDAIERHVVAVADASPIPILLYNNPSVAAGVTLRGEVVRRIAQHPNVVGLKDSSKETYRENLGAASPKFCVLAGSAAYWIDALRNGASGGVLSLANVFPDECAKLYRAFVDGRKDEVEALDRRLADLNSKISAVYGVAGVKAAMTLAGYVGGVMRRPYRALDAQQVAGLERELKGSGFLRP